jgi:predicted regulator of amino acid metabolism with ACT domain
MWQEILDKFKRFPAQEKVIRLILQRGFQINDASRVVSGRIEIPHAQIAKELDVDRRVVDTRPRPFAMMKIYGRSSRMCAP